MEFFSQLIILITVGVIFGIICKRLNIPLIVGYILGGAIFAFFSLGENSQTTMLNNLSQIGISLLLFSIGMEFSLDKLLQVKKYAIIGGVVQIILTILFGKIIFPMFGFSGFESLFLGAVFSLSSTAVVIKILEELGEMDKLSSEITLGWLILQDIAVVILIILLGNLSKNAINSSDLISSLLKCFILIAVSLVLGRKILPKVLTSIARFGAKELVVISAFGFCLLFAFLAEKLGVSSTIGAFLAGIMISESVLNHEIITEIKPLQSLFAMLFFITIGSLFSIKFVFDNLILIFFLTLVIIFAKIIIITLICSLLKLHAKTSLQIALNLAQIGEFAFLSAQIGLTNSWINPRLNSIIIAVTVISLVLAPVFITNGDRIYQALGKLTLKFLPSLYRKIFSKISDASPENDITELKNHIIICGYGRVGKYLALALKKLKQKFIIIELNSISELEGSKEKMNYLIGDSTNIDILQQAKIEKAKIAIITLPKEEDVGEVIRVSKALNPDIQLIIRKHHESKDFDQNDVFAIIEPEFEATIKMLEKLMLVLRKKDKNIINWVREQKKQLN